MNLQYGALLSYGGPWTVVVPTLKGGVRLCEDFTKINKFIKRPMHSVKNPKEAVGAINPRAKFFCTFDASKGYW